MIGLTTTGFASLQIDPLYLNKLTELGITQPSSIQAEAIPHALAGKDVVAQSQTGTGKTLAYVLPVLHRLEPELREVQALILVPTRELGMQIVRTVEELTQGGDIRVQQLIGGASIERQIDKLRLKPQIVVGTPGRVQELVKLRKLKLSVIRTVVVDEVDQVFELGSIQEVEALFKGMLRDRQLLFFSATFPPRAEAVIDRWMRDPVHVRVNPAQRTAETLEHLYFVSEERNKIDTLRRLVRLYNPKAGIVFINDTDDIGAAVSKLKYAGLSVEGLYGDSFKQERAKAMQAFRAGRFQLLLATDVAARGLDLPQVSHVFNLDPPIDADHYVHRVGRTGRMGRQGTAISIITNRQQFIIDKFAKTLGIELKRRDMFHGKVIDPAQEKAIRDEARGRRTGDSGKGPRGAADTRTAGARPASGREEGRVRRPDGTEAAGTVRRSEADSRNGARSTGERTAGRAAISRNAQRPGTSSEPGGASRDAGKTGAKPGGAKPAGRAAAASDKRDAPPQKRKTERERELERKSKGAPRWLKAKPERPSGGEPKL